MTVRIGIELPEWCDSFLKDLGGFLRTPEDRMRFVIAAALKNVTEGTGGPFAAAIFEQDSGRLVSLGLNRVVASNCSPAHAEITAIASAQQKLKTFDLGAPGLPAHEIVINADPCAMCFGSIPWSGVRSVLTGTTAANVERITGFDEGPVHPDWKAELTKRGIKITTGVLAEESLAPLEEYRKRGLPVYNGRRG